MFEILRDTLNKLLGPLPFNGDSQDAYFLVRTLLKPVALAIRACTQQIVVDSSLSERMPKRMDQDRFTRVGRAAKQNGWQKI
jgi:hypothetical protein